MGNCTAVARDWELYNNGKGYGLTVPPRPPREILLKRWPLPSVMAALRTSHSQRRADEDRIQNEESHPRFPLAFT